MSYEKRAQLYAYWLGLYVERVSTKIRELNEAFNKGAEALKELRYQEDRSVMQNALIIAMTTTGASRYHKILKDIGPRIVIVEEAAEVFEAHIVSSLTKRCEHLVLIGDHVQLRPNPCVYELARHYHLDVSLFERLVNNETRRVVLACQHRMRPEISSLMRFFYDEPIADHASVMDFPQAPARLGLRHNIFFMTHEHAEQKLSDLGQSKCNPFEVEFITQLCVYLCKQRYISDAAATTKRPSGIQTNQLHDTRITVLTMYLGQMMKLRASLRAKLPTLSIKVGMTIELRCARS